MTRDVEQVDDDQKHRHSETSKHALVTQRHLRIGCGHSRSGREQQRAHPCPFRVIGNAPIRRPAHAARRQALGLQDHRGSTGELLHALSVLHKLPGWEAFPSKNRAGRRIIIHTLKSRYCRHTVSRHGMVQVLHLRGTPVSTSNQRMIYKWSS